MRITAPTSILVLSHRGHFSFHVVQFLQDIFNVVVRTKTIRDIQVAMNPASGEVVIGNKAR